MECYFFKIIAIDVNDRQSSGYHYPFVLLYNSGSAVTNVTAIQKFTVDDNIVTLVG